MLYECLLLLGVLALTFMVPLLILGAGTNYTPPGGVLWLHVFLVLGAYFLWYWRRGGQTLASVVDDIERELIRESMTRHRGNISETARALGLTRRGLYLKLRRLGLESQA